MGKFVKCLAKFKKWKVKFNFPSKIHAQFAKFYPKSSVKWKIREILCQKFSKMENLRN